MSCVRSGRACAWSPIGHPQSPGGHGYRDRSIDRPERSVRIEPFGGGGPDDRLVGSVVRLPPRKAIMGAHALIEPRRSVAIKASFLALVLAASLFALARANATAATAYSTVQPGSFTGSAFDACTAPPAASMTAWKASPYKAIGIYIGGVSRGCTQANLTAAWVQQQVTAGWKLLPLYVGPQ